jgi:hypothetical protein
MTRYAVMNCHTVRRPLKQIYNLPIFPYLKRTKSIQKENSNNTIIEIERSQGNQVKKGLVYPQWKDGMLTDI